ncbi:MAG: tetratricopeptide repeat protein [bacterium]|nr:tetratricopeptide repeat protein [bacterium]
MHEVAAPHSRWVWRRWIAAGAAVLVLAGLTWWIYRPAINARPSVAVWSFTSITEDPSSAWLSTALSEVLSTELAVDGKLRSIPGETIARMRQELALTEADDLSLETIQRIGKSLSTDFIAVGSYRAFEENTDRRLSLDLRLLATQDGEARTTIEHAGLEAELYDLVTEVASSLRKELGAGRLSFADEARVRATLPTDPEAFRHYLEGLDRLRSFDALTARDSLGRAIEIDPDYALAHAVLSQAWSALGYDLQAELSAKRAYELAEGLPREENLRIEGRYYQEAKEWQKAIDIYQELWRSFPDNLDYGLRLAEVQITAGRGPDALATVERLHTLPLPAGDDPRIELVEAAAAFSVADHRAQLAAAERAVEKARALGASILVAEALRSKGEASFQLFQSDEAETALSEASRLFTEAGDQGKVAQVLSSIANVLNYEADHAGAARLYQQALSIHREIGQRGEVALIQNNLAVLLFNRGDLGPARTMLEEAVAVGRELGDRHSEATYLDTLVEVLLRQGDLRAARELAQEELTLYQQIGNRSWSAWSYFNLGRVALAAGDVRRARELHETALVISDELAEPYLTGYVLDGLARSLLAAGDLVTASRMATDSLDIRSDLGGTATLADSQVTAALILLENGPLTEAEALARRAIHLFDQEARPDDQALATSILARVLLAQGRRRDSEAALDAATARAEISQNPTVRLTVAMDTARLLAATGRRAEALRRLEAAAAEARRLGLVSLELEARLAWGEAELAAGGRPTSRASARARLEALAADAIKAGFDLIADKAAAVGSRSGTPIILPSSALRTTPE